MYSLAIIWVINVILLVYPLYGATLLTSVYGDGGSITDNVDINQGRIYEIADWTLDGNYMHVWGWKADQQTKTPTTNYGTGQNHNSNTCTGFTLSSDDYITGYTVWDDEGNTGYIAGLQFNTRNNNTYSCTSGVGTAYSNNYNYDTYDFWYLTGWKVRDGAIIDQIQLQFTKSTLTALPTKQPTSSSPTKYPTSNPTADPTIDPTTDPTIDPTTNPSIHPTADPTIDPTQDPTDDPTLNPTPSPTFRPTMSPIQIPTASPTNNNDKSGNVGDEDDGNGETEDGDNKEDVDNDDDVDYKTAVLWGGIGLGVFGGCIIIFILYCYIAERAKKNAHSQFKNVEMMQHTVPTDDYKATTNVPAPKYTMEYMEKNEIYGEHNIVVDDDDDDDDIEYDEEEREDMMKNQRRLYYQAQFMQTMMNDQGQQTYLMNMDAMQRKQYIEHECELYIQRIEDMHRKNTLPLLKENNNDTDHQQNGINDDESLDDIDNDDYDDYDSSTKDDESDADENIVKDIETM